MKQGCGCPATGRELFAFIKINDKTETAIVDGNGNAYKTYGEGYAFTESKCLPENKYDPKYYQFIRFLGGFDF